MNTKLVMTIAAFFMGILGIMLSFLPQEIASLLGEASTPAIILQITGGLYFGFAMTNWIAKANLIGGIYGRPIAIGNFAHFTIVALALVKYSFAQGIEPYMVILTIIYIAFAVNFGYIFFTHPATKNVS